MLKNIWKKFLLNQDVLFLEIQSYLRRAPINLKHIRKESTFHLIRVFSRIWEYSMPSLNHAIRDREFV